jgi:hypothetical protein
MKKEDIKKGDYIYEYFNDGREFINIITNHYNHVNIYLEKGKNFNPCGTLKIHFNKNTRYATPEEISWLDACIKANKYIPFEEINIEPIYEIY